MVWNTRGKDLNRFSGLFEAHGEVTWGGHMGRSSPGGTGERHGRHFPFPGCCPALPGVLSGTSPSRGAVQHFPFPGCCQALARSQVGSQGNYKEICLKIPPLPPEGAKRNAGQFSAATLPPNPSSEKASKAAPPPTLETPTKRGLEYPR